MNEEGSVSRRGFLFAATGAAAAAGASTSAAAQEDDGGDGGGGGSETVALVDYAFEPGTDEPLFVTPGTTVTFVWETGNHNIVVENQPEESEWEGHEPIEDAGFEHEHTFEVEGDYEIYCAPHVSQGMEATITVSEDGPPEEGAGGGPTIPESAKTLGLATSLAMGATLGLAYVFLKYGSGRKPAD